MRRILLSTLKIVVSAALLYFSLRKVDLAELVARIDVSSLGWIGVAIAVTFLQIFVGVLRWREISAECGAPLPTRQAMRFNVIGTFFNQTLPSSIGGDAVRLWLVARSGARLAGRDLFHLRRPRHRPDRARGGHRREPALELPPDHRSARQVGAAVRRFRSPCRRPRISSARPAAVAVAEALVGHPPHPRLFGDRQSRAVQPRSRPESRGAVVAGACARRRHRLVRGAIDRTPPCCSARSSSSFRPSC